MKAGSLLLFLMASVIPLTASADMTPEQAAQMLQQLDQRQRALGDYTATVYIEQRQANERKLVFEAETYRRESTGKFVFLFTKPRTEAGKGYLRSGNSLFIYDPSIGKWDRRTEREKIGGTGSTRQDFDVKNLANDYEAKFVGDEKLGSREVVHLSLEAKKNAAVPFPKMDLWIDTASGLLLKQQDMSLSGKVLRTLYYRKWKSTTRGGDNGTVELPMEIRIYDELNKGEETIIVLKKINVEPIDDSVFTKAWLEQKSR